MRMRMYIQRHGGSVPKNIKDEMRKSVVHKKMLGITKSEKEKWTKAGVETAGFWSRWLLWSKPDKKNACKYIEKKFGLRIKK